VARFLSCASEEKPFPKPWPKAAATKKIILISLAAAHKVMMPLTEAQMTTSK
jgi:hypothetical protein